MKKNNIVTVLLVLSILLNIFLFQKNDQSDHTQFKKNDLLPMESDYTVFTLDNMEEKDDEYIIYCNISLSDVGNQLNEHHILDNEIQLDVSVYFSNEPAYGNVIITDEQTIVEDNWIHAAPITIVCGKENDEYEAKISKKELSDQENETIHNVLNGQYYEYQSIYCTINQYDKEVVVHEANFK